MKKILSILLLISIILILGCSKDDDQITGDVIDDRVEIVDKVVIGPIEEETEEEEEEPEISTIRICSDTDNGIVRWVNGTTSGFTDNAERFEFNDYCLDDHTVMEYYCGNETAQNVSFECKNGCVDAHCV